MADWEAEQSEDRIKDADIKLKDIVSDMRDHIFSVFRKLTAVRLQVEQIQLVANIA